MQKILFVLSEYGYWGEELVGPMETLEKAGYILNFATPTGKRPHALPPSMDSSYVDPPLGKPVVSEEMAQKVEQLEKSDILDEPLSLKELFPLDRPYMSSPEYLREFEEYNRNVEQAAALCEPYAALVLVGGQRTHC